MAGPRGANGKVMRCGVGKQIACERAGGGGPRAQPRRLAANGEAGWPLASARGRGLALGAEGVGQALWEGAPEQG